MAAYAAKAVGRSAIPGQSARHACGWPPPSGRKRFSYDAAVSVRGFHTLPVRGNQALDGEKKKMVSIQ
ncbi:hypothetical protein TGS27_1858 [Geobacillus stearothermophilus]|uniref:Uncharacterized protein n=1 Tax=Geobacillus stearothermophilus TaxID=1422 RepID=A0A150MTB4_GEOSE|nr:hypothetical protein GS8_1426 [Geobacillus stearothermophilus]KYD27717.1 hypothetical protein B4109_0117 [Geobacillus stearothermophilus]KYD31888.1 hypothetical protein B4114_0110 [Geobacillus stearothermophilus]MED4979711.1 hypothetical protein [Geobacillus stearothermophilus]OAO80697.1 hypothetical protein TGS27_1858 [Geobacillus stearothermophilus]